MFKRINCRTNGSYNKFAKCELVIWVLCFFCPPRSAMRCMRVEMSFLFVGSRVLSSSEKHEVYCPFRPHKKKHIIAKVHFECIIVLLFAGARTQWPHVAHYTRGFCCLSAPCTPRCFNATPRPTSVRHDKSPLIF